MKENEVQGLVELKAEYENRLSQSKEYQALREDFNKSAMVLVRESIKSKGISVSDRPLLSSTPLLAAGGCGFCESCITACTGCVTHN